MASESYVWLIPVLPMAAALVIMLVGQRTWRGGAAIALLAVGGSMVLSWGVLSDALGGGGGEASYEWILLTGDSIRLGFLVDNLSAFLAVVVGVLSFLIVAYSVAYIDDQGKARPRYYAEMSLFISGMLGMVLADNLLLMFVFWEIMGLCSYLLIGYWFHKPSAAKAAVKAFWVTRLGDTMLMVAIAILFARYGTFNYLELFEAIEADTAFHDTGLLMAVALLIFGGAAGKSAQFPFHVWIPDAMEGPTTVSALIHAATMVKAGVFLVARMFPLMVLVPNAMLVVGLVGGFTAFFAATMGLVMWDIKRVMAYSTLSQLGYMFLALGAGGYLVALGLESAGYTAGMFHLLNHAFFKALLFLTAGCVGHAFHHAANPYDMRQMGGLRRKMPIASMAMLVGCLALAGVPPFSGFWSKDEVLAAAFEAGGQNSLFMLMWVLGVATALMTGFYAFRMWFLVFAGKSRSDEAENAHDAPSWMTGVIAVLTVLSVATGFVLFVGGSLGDFVFFEHAHAVTAGEALAEVFASPLTYVTLVAAVGGILLARGMYVNGRPSPAAVAAKAPGLHRTLLNRYGFDDLYDNLATKVYKLGLVVGWVDKAVVDGLVNAVGRGTALTGLKGRRWQTGLVSTYVTTIVVGIALTLVFVAYVAPTFGWGR